MLLDALGRGDEALRAYESALDADPDDVETLRALEAKYAAAGAREPLLRVQRRLIGLLPPEQRAASLVRLAQVLEEQLGDLDGALGALRELEQLAGPTAQTTEHIARILERGARFAELAEHLERASASAQGEALLQLELRRAALCRDRLGDPERAIALYRGVLELWPDCAPARSELERSLRAEHRSLGAGRVPGAEPAQRRQPAGEALLFELALLREELGDLERARELYTRICDEPIDAELELQAAARLGALLERRADSWLRAHMERRLGKAAALDAELRQRLAELCLTKLRDTPGACEQLEALGRLAPQRAEHLGAARLAVSQVLVQPLVRAMKTELGCPVDAARAGAAHARGAARARRSRSRAGVAALRARARARPGRRRGLRVSRRALRARRAHRRRGRAARGRARARQPPRAGRRRARRGGSARSGGAAHGAAPAHRGAARRRPAGRHQGCPRARGRTRGKRTVARHRRAARGPVRELRTGRVARRALRAGGARLRYAPAAGGLAAAHGARAAELRRRCEPRTRRRRVPRSARRDPGRSRRRAGALRAAPRARQRPSCSRRCSRLAWRAPSTAPRYEPGDTELSLRLELAELCAGRLRAPERALAQFTHALEVDPLQAAALARALELAEQLGRPDEQLRLLDARLGHPAPAAERAAWLEKRAELLAGPLSRPEEAVGSYTQVLALEPGRTRSSTALRVLLESLGR